MGLKRSSVRNTVTPRLVDETHKHAPFRGHAPLHNTRKRNVWRTFTGGRSLNDTQNATFKKRALLWGFRSCAPATETRNPGP